MYVAGSSLADGIALVTICSTRLHLEFALSRLYSMCLLRPCPERLDSENSLINAQRSTPRYVQSAARILAAPAKPAPAR
jgi:hypothetical protein